MSSSLKLLYLKFKARLRFLFSKPSSAIMCVCLVGFYLFLISINMRSFSGVEVSSNYESRIMMLLGLLGVLLFMTLFTKNKVIIKEDDANMFFTGPYSRKDVMKFVLLNTLTTCLLLGFYPLYFLLCFSVGSGIDFSFIFISYIFSLTLLYFFSVLSDFLHLYEIQDSKNLWISRGIVVVFILIVFALFVINLAQYQFNFELGFKSFLSTPLFNWIPFFGWCKFGLISLVQGNYIMGGLMLLLLIGGCVLISHLFINYKEDFYEQAMSDAEVFTKRYRDAQKGKMGTNVSEEKLVKQKQNFKDGAAAIFSKNILLLKRSKVASSLKGIIFIVTFFAFSIFANMGESYFVMMSVMSIFMSSNDVSIEDELKNYQIYLIPEHSMKKALYCIIPQWFKSFLLVGACAVLYIIGYQPNITSVLSLVLNQLTLGLMTTLCMMLCVKVMKSRNNAMVEQMLKMIMVLVLLIPSIIISVVSIPFVGLNLISLMVIPVIVNLLISGIIFYFVSSIFNGSDIMAD